MLYLILLDPSKEHYSFQAQHFRHHQICLKFLNLHPTYIDIHQLKHIKIMRKSKPSLTFGKFSKHLSSHMKGFMHRNCSLIEHQLKFNQPNMNKEKERDSKRTNPFGNVEW
jgi:hypothetical protein